MELHRLGRAAIFLAGSIIGGLALAFVIVFLHPQLLQRPAAAPAATAAPPPAPAPAPAAAPATAGTSADMQTGAATAAPSGKPSASGAGGTRGRTSDAIHGPDNPRATSESPPTPGSPAGVAAESYAAAVRRAAPAVVNISTARLVTEQSPSVVDSCSVICSRSTASASSGRWAQA